MQKIIYTLALVFSATMLSTAQSITTSTIKWSSTQTFNVSLGDWTEEVTSLISNASTSLVWKNQDGTIRKSFQVIEVIGEWSNVNTDGRVQYEVTDGQFSGTISIRKQGTDTKILIAMASDTPETKELTIQSLQLL